MASAAGSIGKFDFRYKESLGEDSKLVSLDVPEAGAEASENLRFASSLAAYGLWLRDSEYKGDASLQMATDLAKNALGQDPYGLRKEYVDLLNKAATIKQ